MFLRGASAAGRPTPAKLGRKVLRKHFVTGGKNCGDGRLVRSSRRPPEGVSVGFFDRIWPILNEFAFWTAVQLGLIYGFVALGVYLSFRVLDFPDLTVDGSFPLGAAVTAALIVSGVNPWIALVVSIVAGGTAGLVTAVLSVRFRILHLLASILTMFALFSINIRIMGASNLSLRGQDTILTPFYDWGIGIPASCALAFGAGFGVVGLWMGLALGLGSVAMFLLWRWRRRWSLASVAGV